MKVEFSADILENVFADDVVEIYNCLPIEDRLLVLESILGKDSQKETMDLIEEILSYRSKYERKNIIEQLLERYE